MAEGAKRSAHRVPTFSRGKPRMESIFAKKQWECGDDRYLVFSCLRKYFEELKSYEKEWKDYCIENIAVSYL